MLKFQGRYVTQNWQPPSGVFDDLHSLIVGFPAVNLNLTYNYSKTDAINKFLSL